MTPRSEVIQRWWPTTQSLDLVEGSAETVASAVHAEVSRFVAPERVIATCETYPNLDAAFSMVTEFDNVPTVYLILPTRSKWTVLWNNSFLCDGYDSLCYCLTLNHQLTTLHWSAHDTTTTFQARAHFCHRSANDAQMTERQVHVGVNDGNWSFFESGAPLSEEHIINYGARRKKDRLNEESLLQLLGRLGAMPWDEQFYSLPGECFVIRRTSPPVTVLRRSKDQVLRA